MQLEIIHSRVLLVVSAKSGRFKINHLWLKQAVEAYQSELTVEGELNLLRERNVRILTRFTQNQNERERERGRREGEFVFNAKKFHGMSRKIRKFDHLVLLGLNQTLEFLNCGLPQNTEAPLMLKFAKDNYCSPI